MTIHSSGSVWAGFVRKAAEEVDAKFPRKAWTSTYPGHGEISPANGQGNRGQYAVDFMIESKAQGDAIADYVWKNRDRLGLRYVIWYRRIISKTNLPSRWRAYRNPVASRRGTASGDHTNHVHVSFFSNGAYFPLKTEQPKPSTPAKPDPAGDYPRPTTTVVYLDKMVHGQKDSGSVYWVQRRLRELGYDSVKKTGTYDDATELAVKAWQLKVGNDPKYADGILGWNDLHALFEGMDPAITLERES